jgi:hypothetical protein
MTIVPDTKDWTWVLERVCEECGYDARSISRTQVPSTIRSNAAEWLQVLARSDVRRRPSPQTWSPLEYGAHVRDVLKIGRRRLTLMLGQDDPLFENWDQNETAEIERYWEQDPLVVSRALLEEADSVARAFAGVDDTQWRRRGRRSDGAAFTIESFARYLIHDPVHHLHDVSE